MKQWCGSFLICVFSIFVLASCSDVAVTDKHVEDTYEEAKNMLDSYEESSPIITYQGMWLSDKTYDETEALDDPDFLSQSIALSTWYPLSLSEVTNRIAKMTGISLRFSTDLLAYMDVSVRLSPDSQKALLEDISNQNLKNPMTMKVAVRYQGSMKQLLNWVSERFNVFWRYEAEADAIWFYQLDTRSFTLFLPGEVSSQSDFVGELPQSSSRSGGGGGRGGGGGPQYSGSNSTSTMMKIEHGFFDKYVDGVKTLLTHMGRIQAIPSTGTIIVTDVPHVLYQVDRFINEQNRQLTQQVALQIKVLEVSMRDGVDFDATWQNLVVRHNGKFLGSLSSSSLGGVEQANSLLTSVLGGKIKTSTGVNDQFTTNLLFRALADKARISTVTSTSLVSLSNQPVPLKIVDEKSYVSGRVSTINPGSDGTFTSDTISTNKVVPGFIMTLIPKVLDKGRIMLQMSIEVSSLTDLVNFEGADSETLVQLPELSRRTVGQRVIVNSGQTLVMSGFERVNHALQEQGTGKSNFWLFGGGRAKEYERSILLILITPVLLGS